MILGIIFLNNLPIFVNFFRPRALVIENVVGLATHNNGSALAQMQECFANLGYDCDWRILNAAHFGVPQRRERLIFIGLQKGSALSDATLVLLKCDIQLPVQPVLDRPVIADCLGKLLSGEVFAEDVMPTFHVFLAIAEDATEHHANGCQLRPTSTIGQVLGNSAHHMFATLAVGLGFFQPVRLRFPSQIPLDDPVHALRFRKRRRFSPL